MQLLSYSQILYYPLINTKEINLFDKSVLVIFKISTRPSWKLMIVHVFSYMFNLLDLVHSALH